MRDSLDGGKKSAPKKKLGSSQADGLASPWLLKEKQHSSIPAARNFHDLTTTHHHAAPAFPWAGAGAGEKERKGSRTTEEVEENKGGGRKSEKKGDGKRWSGKETEKTLGRS